MYRTILIVFLLSCCNAAGINAQSSVVLVNQHRPSKKIVLKNESDVFFITAKGSYNGSILSTTDSSIRLSRYYKTGMDSFYTKKVRVSNRHKEGLKLKKLPLYARDTMELLLKDILIVKKPWINKRGWMLIPAYLLGGAVLALPLLPVAAITKGRAGVRNWLLFEGLMVGIAGPSLFIGTRSKKYVIGEKWQLLIKEP